MPPGGEDARCFTQLAGDYLERIFRHAENIDLDMMNAGYAKLCADLAWQNIQILKALENAGERAGMRVSDYS
jgi:hypothetical protein